MTKPKVALPTPLLREIVPGQIWTHDEPFAKAGLEIGARMTIVRLQSGDLWVHSPLEPVPELRRALDEIGAVRFIVAPNRMHYLGAAQFAAAYPTAQLWAAPGLAAAQPKIAFYATLGDQTPAAWGEDLEQLVFSANFLNEVLFLHRASRTLIVTDFCFYLPDGAPLTRFYAKLSHIQQRPGPSAIFKIITRDRAAARQTLVRLLEWDFDRIILSHGALCESGAKEALRQSFAWLLADA